MNITLGELFSAIETEFSLSVDLLKPYMDLLEVRDFIERRESDLKQFKSLTHNCRVSESVIAIISYLRDIKAPSKFYGGICKRGAGYFKIPQKVLEKIRSTEAQMMLSVKSKEELHFDKDYCIPDELSPEEFAVIYG